MPAAPVGARWVAGLGAFLLVAAAATFVAVRWDDIPDAAKLAALVAVTCCCIAGHRALRSSLPVTAEALFHLGVLLVPIDVAAVGIHAGWMWPQMLFAQGLTATVVFGIAAQVERSVVLRLAAWVGVVVLAAGVGAMTTLPAGLVLAATALVVVAGRRVWPERSEADLDLAATGWATLAGLAVPLAGADQLGWPAAGVLVDLGLAGDPLHPLAAATGLVAGLTLGIVAHRRRSVPLALAGVACALVEVTTSGVSQEPADSASLVGAAALLLVAELAAWLWRSDAFWGRVTHLVALAGELIGAFFTIVLIGVVLLAPVELPPDPLAGVAAGLLAIAWLTALTRRPVGPQREPWGWTPSAAAVAGAAAVTLWTGSGTAAAVAMTVLGTAVLFGPAAGTSTGPPTGRVLAAGLLGWAPVAGYDHPALAGALGLIGAVALAEAAVRTTWLPRHRPAVEAAGQPSAFSPWRAGPLTVAVRTWAAEWAVMLTLAALLPLVTGALVVAADGWDAAAAIGAVGAAWLVAAVLDRAGRAASVPMAMIPRMAALVPLAVAHLLEPSQAAVLGCLVVVLAIIDAFRLDQPFLVIGAGFGGPVAVVGLGVASGWSLAQAGLGVMLSGVAWLGIGGTLPRRWVTPTVACAAIAAGTGLALTFDDPAYLSTGLLVFGAALAVVGLGVGRTELIAVGLAVATVGLWGHLALAEVEISEPYLAPVAVLLLAAGFHARRRAAAGAPSPLPPVYGVTGGGFAQSGEVSSWVAYAPAVGLLGGAALLERLSGGPAWHALLAGSVGLLAVVAGGAWRLAGPLLLGTTLVVAVTVHETLDVTAGVPTWAWLAVGGAVLLAAGVAMEQRGTGPYETGRRLVDLVRERFV